MLPLALLEPFLAEAIFLHTAIGTDEPDVAADLHDAAPCVPTKLFRRQGPHVGIEIILVEHTLLLAYGL